MTGRKGVSVFGGLIVFCIAGFCRAGGSGSLVQKELFISGRGGYHTYRIPSIVSTIRGTLLAFCEGRKNSHSDTGDIDLLMRRSLDSGKTWSEPSVIWDNKDNTCGNPCAAVDEETGTVWLLLTWNLGSDHEKQIKTKTGRDTRRVYVMQSNDDGKTWSKPAEITDSVKAEYWRWYATGPGHGIQLKYGSQKGRLIIPADHSYAEFMSDTVYGAHVIYSDDHGKTWRYSDPILPGLNENEVVELLDGKLLMNARNHRYRGSRAMAFSTDCGRTWPYVSYQSNLQEPQCQASILRYSPNSFSNQDRILFSNPAHDTRRMNLSVKLSYDAAKTWPVSKSLYAGPSAYSCLAVLTDGRIACLYEAGRDSPYEKIILAVFSLDWLTNGKDAL